MWIPVTTAQRFFGLRMEETASKKRATEITFN